MENWMKRKKKKKKSKPERIRGCKEKRNEKKEIRTKNIKNKGK